MAIDKRIAISGASGFVGFNLCKFLYSQGVELTTFVRSNTHPKAQQELESISKVYELGVDLTETINPDLLSNIDFVIHLASYAPTVHKINDLDQLIDSNIRLGLHLANAASSSGSKFLNIGTNWQHYEGDLYNPVTLYAATKQAMQDLLQYFLQINSISSVTLDLSDTYGPNDFRDKLIPKLIRHSKSNEPVSLTNGDQLIDLVHIYDVIDAIWLIISNWEQHTENGKYSISSGSLITVKELISDFERIFECNLEKHWGKFSGNPRKMYKSMAIYSHPIGWKPQMSLENGLSELRLSMSGEF